MSDPRIEAYAKLLVEECVDVQPGWQVLVSGGALARPLLEEVSRHVARRGAYAIQRVSLAGTGINLPWAVEAPDELLDTPAPIETVALKEADGWVSIEAPENTRELAAVPQDRLARIQAGLRPHLDRVLNYDLKWVGCQFPTAALAQDADMSLAEFEDFLYGACLLDWSAERERMSRYAEHFDKAEEAFKKAIELKPDHADAYNGLANIYNAQRKFDLAGAASAKASELTAGAPGGMAGGNADSLYNQGVTFSVYSDQRGTEKIFPICLVPRVIDAAEWSVVERGLTQRIGALNHPGHQATHDEGEHCRAGSKDQRVGEQPQEAHEAKCILRLQAAEQRRPECRMSNAKCL